MNDEHQTTHVTQDSETESAKAPKPKKTSEKRSFFSSKRNRIVVALVIVVAIVGLLVKETYRRPPSDTLVRMMSSVLPLPAVTVNGDTVSLSDYLEEYDALVHSFEAAAENGATLPEDTEIQDAIIETIINKTLLRQMAEEYGVSISEDDVNAYYQEILVAQESEEVFAEELENTFGWTVDEFKDRIVEPIVLLTEMTDFVLLNDEMQTERLAVIEAGYERLEAGEDFDYVADEIHAQVDPTLDVDLGYVKLSIIPEDWVEAVEELEVGLYTDIQHLYEGYAIFQVLDRIIAGEDTQLQLYGMTVPKKTLEEVLLEVRETSEIENHLE